ncbi:MAG: polyribonucleotide nucleotidyltransferase [Desulfitobacteriaceae bacterium]|nr:polyribonucleotide nucleotidyltransferase [Desulfitobacteriaceae bacterium]MDD4751780.1 polyribonucleotide nucleotidyltransferase [Desulfitobacteriaceae bacterium]
MQNQAFRKSMDLGERTLTLETGRMAKQASGAVFTTYGDTMILATATGSNEPREGIDFFPLTVDYEERLYAVGKIPGGFIKREGRPSEKAILSSRMIDRPIRPLFPKGYRNDVQVVTTVMSVDQDNPPDITAMNGASAALAISGIPFQGPIGAVSVGRVDGKLIINPTVEQGNQSDMRITVAGTKDAVIMVEAAAKEVPEEEILEAIMFGHDNIKKIVAFIEEFRSEAIELGLAKEKREFTPEKPAEELEESVRSYGTSQIDAAIRKCALEKMAKKHREIYLKETKEEIIAHFAEEYPEDGKNIKAIVDSIEKEVLRRIIAQEKMRIDGRNINEVRPISVEVGVLSRTHGSALFTRGQTQILNACTLGAVGDEQILDGLGIEESKRYMHHYNFPPYSVGEARPIRGPGRREIGHGALAERALEPVIPCEEDFPYTIRLVSEAIESNGSTSMGSVCGSTLSLMDAGVPIKAPVAGVAMGLIKDEEHITVLTDIQGIEDFLGDMDFKVAGTAKGVTAIQMDIKIFGINREVLQQALAQAKEGRMHILGKMLDVISEPRKELSPYAPRIIRTKIHPDKIRDVIGTGGKIIKKIIEDTGASIDIEDDGRIFIASVDGAMGEKALKIIESITQDVEVGRTYLGKVVKVMDFGAFVEVIPGVLDLPGKEGMVHISQLSEKRVAKVTDVVKEGEEVLVKAIGIDNQGRVKLSRKEALRDKEA